MTGLAVLVTASVLSLAVLLALLAYSLVRGGSVEGTVTLRVVPPWKRQGNGPKGGTEGGASGGTGEPGPAG